MPMVRPSMLRAPSADASITPPLPPLIRIAPARAISRPTSYASLRTRMGASPAPITAITMLRRIGSTSQQLGQVAEIGDREFRRREPFGIGLLMLVDPDDRHARALGSHDVLVRRVPDEQHFAGSEPQRLERPVEERGMRLAQA